MNLSKSIIKQINSLEMKKYRKESGLFVAEGTKIVCDNINSMRCEFLIATEQWRLENPDMASFVKYTASKDEMSKISFLKTPQEVIGVFEIPHYTLNIEELKDKLTLVLDTVQDPGNLGTIIRIADWFGIENIVCSPASADCYAPKVVQATMGAVSRVKVHYRDLCEFLKEMEGCNIFGTFLDGENIYKKTLPQTGLIIMGNEGKGISDEVARFVNGRLFIPNFPQDRETSESLNVAVATSIICSEFRRSM